MNISYVTYDQFGMLTGGYLQEILPEHLISYIEVSDEVRINWTAYRANDARNAVELYSPTQVATLIPTAKEIEKAIQANLDRYAQSWGYNDIASACTYVGDPCAKFNSEALALRQWRSDTWLTVETVNIQIAAGTQIYPQTIEAAISMLPAAPARPA